MKLKIVMWTDPETFERAVERETANGWTVDTFNTTEAYNRIYHVAYLTKSED